MATWLRCLCVSDWNLLIIDPHRYSLRLIQFTNLELHSMESIERLY